MKLQPHLKHERVGVCKYERVCVWGGGVLKFVALPRSLQQTGLADAVAAVVASSLVDPTFEPGHLVSQMWADPCQGEVVTLSSGAIALLQCLRVLDSFPFEMCLRTFLGTFRTSDRCRDIIPVAVNLQFHHSDS